MVLDVKKQLNLNAMMHSQTGTEYPADIDRSVKAHVVNLRRSQWFDRDCQKKVIAVIPAYNEAQSIGAVVYKMRQYADIVLVIDDGSADDTAQAAQSAGALVIRHLTNYGKGVALKTGFSEARKLEPDIVVTIDADAQHLPEETIGVIAPIATGQADISVGSRYLADTSVVPKHRIWGHRFLNLLINLASGVSLTDTQSGFRAFSAKALQVISFQSHGFAVESEMQFLAYRHQLKVKEVPITVKYHQAPKRSVIKQGVMVLLGVLQLALQHRPLFSASIGIPPLFLSMALFLWGGNLYLQVAAKSSVIPSILIGLTTLSLMIWGIFQVIDWRVRRLITLGAADRRKQMVTSRSENKWFTRLRFLSLAAIKRNRQSK